jgi:radical SAM enzyme (TIGR01210 family)
MRVDPNPYLGGIMRAIRHDRPTLRADQPFFTRVERVRGGSYVEIWFRTGGCTWDRVGGCTMCNYGVGEDSSADEIVAAVSQALQELDEPAYELMISPSGGMWDAKEVPTEALARVYDLARETGPNKFFVETRAETVNFDRVDELRAAFGDLALAVELGMESGYDGILAHCVNKGSSTETFHRAATIAAERDVEIYANVSLGTALLDRRTATWDALASTRWALSNGADRVVLFPLHIKPYTLLDVLHDSGRFERVSLWDLVEVLSTLGRDGCRRTEVAWYKSYYDTEDKVRMAPGGCDRCLDRLVRGLDRYRATQDHADAVALDASRCKCAGPRQLVGSAPEGAVVADLILEGYADLADTLAQGEAWRRHQPLLRRSVPSAFADYSDFLVREVDRAG